MRIPGVGALSRLAWSLAMSEVVPTRWRLPARRRLGLRNAQSCTIAPGVAFPDPTRVTIAPGTFINRGAYVDPDIAIGRDVFIGPGSHLLSHHHPIGPATKRAAGGQNRSVRIGDGTWIGAGAIVLPGVTVGNGCVIAAGAVVTKDCDPNGLYAGVPAKRIKDLPEAQQELGEIDV